MHRSLKRATICIFVQRYANFDEPSRLTSLIHDNADTYAKDCNQGLITRVQSSYYTRALKMLERTYSRVTCADVMRVTGAATEEEAKAIRCVRIHTFILSHAYMRGLLCSERLVALGYVAATVEPDTGAVRFAEASAADAVRATLCSFRPLQICTPHATCRRARLFAKHACMKLFVLRCVRERACVHICVCLRVFYTCV